MIKFVLVEDNSAQRKMVKEIVIKFMMKNKIDFDILEYSDETPGLINVIKNNNSHNIYILDFELPSSNAIEIARTIREDDWRSPIIILTVHGGMAFDTFKQRLQILDFLNKQYEPEKNLLELFEICLKQLNFSNTLSFRMKNVDYKIPLDSIYQIYRETTERKVVIVTATDEYRLNIGMKEIYEKLNSNFVFTHKASIVNMKKVKKIDWKNYIIFFDNNTSSILVSRTHKKEITEHAMV